MRNKRKYILAFIAVALMIGSAASITGGAAFAESQADRDKRSEEQALRAVGLAATTEQCFTSGSPVDSANDPAGTTFMKICITNHGNISKFESPAGKNHLFGREGYAVCSGVDNVHGFDVGSAEEGWGEPTVTQPNGTGKLPLIVKRNSLDGRVQHTQTFTTTPADLEVQVAMAVKNISSKTFVPVLMRNFDGDIDDSASDDVYDVGQDFVWGTQRPAGSVATREGLMLTLNSTPGFAPFFLQEAFGAWNPNGSTFRSGRGCGFGQSVGGPAAGDFVGRVGVGLGNLTPGQTKTVTVRYRRF